MSSGKNYKASGLQTSPNKLSGVSEGGLAQADSVILRNAHVLEPRRGHTAGSQFGTSSVINGNALAFFEGGRVVQYTDSSRYITRARAGAILDTSTVRLFRCDEIFGDLLDAAGGPNIPTYTAGTVGSGDGQILKARTFSGSGANFFTNVGSPYSGDYSNMQTQNWSVEFWCKPSTSAWGSDPTSHVVIAAAKGTPDPFTGTIYYVEIDKPTSKVRVIWENGTPGDGVGGTGTLSVALSIAALSFDVWTHVGVVVQGNGAASTCKFYINGALSSTATGLAAPTMGYTYANLYVGINPALTYQWWSGSLDDIRVSNIARTAAEILDTYNRGIGSFLEPEALAYDTGSGTWTTYSTGAYEPPDSTLLRTKFAEAQQSLFVTTSEGVKVTTALATAPVNAGVFKAWEAKYFVSADVSWTDATPGPWLNADAKVGYRIVWGYEDEYKRVILGAPSGSTYISIPASEAPDQPYSPQIRIPIPYGATTNHFYQVYRTNTSEGADVDPTEDYYKILEAYPPTLTQTLGVGAVSGNATTATATLASHGLTTGTRIFIGTGSAATTSGTFASNVYEITSTGTNTFTFLSTGNGTNTSSLSFDVWDIYHKDVTPDAAMFVPLYTNDTDGDGLGEKGAQFQPPLAKDLTLWDDRLWFANTTSKQLFKLTLLGIGAPDGIHTNPGDGVSDTITIAGTPYTFRSDDDVSGTTGLYATDQVLVHNSGDPSLIASDIEKSAKSLISRINQHSGNDHSVYAYYLQPSDSLVGEIWIESTDVGGDEFSVYASRPASWFPALTSTVTGARVSKSDALKNRLFYSKSRQPEAVPLLNFLDVGSANKAILRIIEQGDRLFVLKEDGIYVVSGSYPNFRVDSLDATTRLVVPDTAVAFNNRILGLTNRGVAAIGGGGVQILSTPINDSILPYIANSNAKLYSWGAAYESEKQYILGLASTNAVPSAVECFVFNGLDAGGWTRWPISRKFAGVNPSTDKLELLSYIDRRVYVENKAWTYADYADNHLLSYSLSTIVGTAWTFSVAPLYLSVGDIIQTANGALGYVSAVVSSTLFTVTTLSGSPNTGSTVLYNSIPCAVEWLPFSAGVPDHAKAFKEYTLHFQNANIRSFSSTFRTELQTTQQTQTLASVPFTYGLNPSEMQNIRRAVPLEAQRGAFLRVGITVQEALSRWALAGWTVEVEDTSQRNSRG